MMVYGAISMCIIILGFAYIVMVLANKESGNMKLAGQILSVLIAIIAIVALVLGSMGYRGMMMGGKGDGMCSEKCEMMMDKMMKDNPKMMDMMKDKGMMDKTMGKKMMKNK